MWAQRSLVRHCICTVQSVMMLGEACEAQVCFELLSGRVLYCIGRHTQRFSTTHTERTRARKRCVFIVARPVATAPKTDPC